MALIEREAALKVLEAWPQLLEKLGVTLSPQANDMLTDCIRAICGVKAIDATPVVHGRWMGHLEDDSVASPGCMACSHCGFQRRVNDNFGRAVSCPNCGARMDGGVGHEA